MKATPIPVTMAKPKPPRPIHERHPLVDVEPRPPRTTPDRKPGTLTTLACRLQAACEINDHDWLRKRSDYIVSCRRAIAVLLRRSRIQGHWSPPSYPEIAVAMGRDNHSGIIGMCREYRHDPAAQEIAAKMEPIVTSSGHGMYSMDVVSVVRDKPKARPTRPRTVAGKEPLPTPFEIKALAAAERGRRPRCPAPDA